MPARKIVNTSAQPEKFDAFTHPALDSLGSVARLADDATRLYIEEVVKELEAGSYNLQSDLEIESKNKEIRRRVLMSLLRKL